jgi:hypothetical protein
MVLMVLLLAVLALSLPAIIPAGPDSSSCAYAQPAGAPPAPGAPPVAAPPAPTFAPAASPARTTNTIVIAAVVLSIIAIVAALALRKKP